MSLRCIKWAVLLGIVFLAGLFHVSGVWALTTSGLASATTFQPRPSVQAVYSGDINTYWPVLGNREQCEARQDLLLQVAPAGCTPSVVRSDLLAEQNVPVFCQINALQVNPLIDLQQIRSISFSGNYPKDIIGAGYYPAKAALRSRDKLLGSALINNIGYVVVILRKNEKEKELPEFVNVTLSGRISYEADNAYGVGKAEFILEPVNDYDWENEKFKQSFWNGRYFVRLEKAEAEYVIVSLYEGVRKIATMKVKKGEMSEPVWVPGMYCRAGLQVAYDDMVIDQDRAVIDITTDKGTDRIGVYKGSRFLNGKCVVEDIKVYTDGLAGEMSVKCDTGEKFKLELFGKNESKRLYLSGKYDKNSPQNYNIYQDSVKNNLTLFTISSGSVFLNGLSVGKIENGIITIEDFENALKTSYLDNEEKKSAKKIYSLLNGAKIEEDIIIPKSTEVKNEDLTAEIESEYNDAVAALEKVVDEYPAEREKDISVAKVYGQEALKRAIALSFAAGKETERARLMRKYINTYPDDAMSNEYRYEINRMDNMDFSNSIGIVKIDNKFANIRVVELQKPKKISSALFSVAGAREEKITVNAEQLKNVSRGGAGTLDSIRLDNVIDEDNVAITANCIAKIDEKGNVAEVKSQSLKLKAHDKAVKVCDKSYINLESINYERVAKIRLVPKSQGTDTITNLSINIGIEKRAIKLSTDKTEEMIKNLNESIKKWENINNKLGNVVKGLKGACLATAGVLTAKNFITGLSGEALARNKVMQGENGWNRKCANLVSLGEYGSLTECYNAKSPEISKDVSETQKIIDDMNKKIAGIEKNAPASGGGFLGMDKGVDRSKAAVDYCNDIKTNYGEGENVTLKNGETKTLGEILGDCEKGYNTEGAFGYEQLREIEYNIKLRNSGASAELKNTTNMLQSSYQAIYDNRARFSEAEKLRAMASQGVPAPAYASSKAGRANIVTQVLPAGGMTVKSGDMEKIEKGKYLASVSVGDSRGNKNEGFAQGIYYTELVKDDQGGYPVQEVYNSSGTKLNAADRDKFLKTYNIGRITATDTISYANTYSNPEVRYYEREPYKGMPAVVPFDVQEGWYAATKQTLPIMGGTKAFDESGRVMSFYLCNVGKNGREQFFEGLGDDICQQINLNTGQPLGFFHGLDERKAKQKISEGLEALNEAANQYGKKSVLIRGRNYLVGNPAASIPSAQCQNFMSPEDCKIMFNVCDPVICPSSRCDLGGKWPVADVIQTGIIGSAVLCLPNIREGIIIPVCLTGIHAGIEGYVSILKDHRDCLQESLSNGRMIGICDQIYSVYLCEFFWRQIAPVAKILLPKLIESAYGEGTRGGGEYLGVMAAWENTQNSINYFTQSYAVNSMKAFQIRSVEEAGTPICKSFVSAKFPTDIETFVEPDSPPQFHAWFSSIKFSDVTVPATSQYKVFYHIYAGKDTGVQYSVYMKNPPENSYYAVPAVVQVAYGFVGKGQYAFESKDMTLPEGYKELCVRVNEQEECGFGEVSTSMAMDYLSDSYASSELKEKDIKSEKECISGTPNLGAALASGPNIQAGVEGVIAPEVSKRGIVRICSTNNPGSQTNPMRFVEVGYCDDTKIKCWLDKESVKNAISDSDKLLENSTLSEIEKTQQARMIEQGAIIGNDAAAAEIKIFEAKSAELKKKLNSAKNGEEVVVRNDINMSIERMRLFLDVIILNHHKANILYMIGDLKAAIVEKDIEAEKVVEATVIISEAAKATASGGASSGEGSGAAATASGASGSGAGTSGATGGGGSGIHLDLENEYEPQSIDKNYVMFGDVTTKMYVKKGYFYLNDYDYDVGFVSLLGRL